MTVEIISWSISTKVWDRAGIELATPGSAVRLASVARHVIDSITRPGISVSVLSTCSNCTRVCVCVWRGGGIRGTTMKSCQRKNVFPCPSPRHIYQLSFSAPHNMDMYTSDIVSTYICTKRWIADLTNTLNILGILTPGTYSLEKLIYVTVDWFSLFDLIFTTQSTILQFFNYDWTDLPGLNQY